MYYDSLLQNLYKCLIGSEDCNNNIIRKHNKNLNKLGEFSFSADILMLCRNILGTSSLTLNTEESMRDVDEVLLRESKQWQLQISKCQRLGTSVHIFIAREPSYKKIIQQTLHQNRKYGAHKINLMQKISLLTDVEEPFNLQILNLSQLRLLLLKEVTLRLLEFNKSDEENLPRSSIYLSLKLDKSKEKAILCGGVLNVKSTTNCSITAEEFYRKRTIDMRLMAEHKYGLRITSDINWQIFFEKLGQAAVRVELLQNNPCRTVTINVNDPTASSSKGASFILYNCARLATLFKEFEKRVAANVYPALPLLDNVDFSLLKQPEEWELLFLYVLQFPQTVHSCIKDILRGKINIHNLCNTLCGMCSTFSIYYRRIRVLTEPRSHLFAVLHARIYLLKAVEQVLHNGLYLLNIEPVKQM